MTDFDSGQVRFDHPGIFRVRDLGGGEPTSVSSSVAGWLSLGHILEPPTFNKQTHTEPVNVQTSKEPIDYATLSRMQSVTVTFAEDSALLRALVDGRAPSYITQDGQNWTEEPMDENDGDPARFMLLWDFSPVLANNTLRYLGRRVMVDGAVAQSFAKGATVAGTAVTFRILKPTDGVTKSSKVWGSGRYNVAH